MKVEGISLPCDIPASCLSHLSLPYSTIMPVEVIQLDHSGHSVFFSLKTSDIWGRVILSVRYRAIQLLQGLASTLWMLVSSSITATQDNQKFLYSWPHASGGEDTRLPTENHCFVDPSVGHSCLHSEFGLCLILGNAPHTFPGGRKR